MAMADRLAELYGLEVTGLERLDVRVNDVVKVDATSGRFALKLYNVRSRGPREVGWEVALVEHLARNGAPVARPIPGVHGAVESISLDGEPRAAVLWRWAPGAKPTPSRATYLALGEAAARVHAAADGYEPAWMRDEYDADALIDEQIARMRRHLLAAGRYEEVLELAERLRARVLGQVLDRGVCHMDLTLDNVHGTAEGVTVFDFDSAGRSWRAIEPAGVLRFSEDLFHDWLEGYRRVRPFSPADERAVAAFVIIGDLRATAWKLGEGLSSRGAPMLTAAELPGVVDDWRAWERTRLGRDM
jgi:Ser/Thr protein kinase RdoA (MazF antagonist)